jgi:hypothetical protein
MSDEAEKHPTDREASATTATPKKKGAAAAAAAKPKKTAPKSSDPNQTAPATTTEANVVKKKASAPRKRKAPVADDGDDAAADTSDKGPRTKAKKTTTASKINATMAVENAPSDLSPSKGGDGEDDDPKFAEKKDRNEIYEMVLKNIRNKQSVILDTRWNLAYTLPKKANVALTPERWRQVVSDRGDKLTTDVVCVNPHTLTIEDPLVLVDIQPARASPSCCWLNEREINLKLKNLVHTTIMLGSSSSLARHAPVAPTAVGDAEEGGGEGGGNESKKGSVKKTFTPGEWIVWVRSGTGQSARHFPMTIATFAELVRTRPTAQPITISSPSGWAMFSEEDRIFVVPRNFLPASSSSASESSRSATAATAAAPITPPPDVTPAVSLSQNSSSLLPPPPSTSS